MLGKLIKNLFLPERIKEYYLFSKRVIGFDIGKHHISAAQVYIHGRRSTIEKVVSLPLPEGTPTDYQERVAHAIRYILNTFDSYDEICTTLSSSVVVYKELSLPFTNREQISMIIDYEVESFLPFTLDQAIIDFIITKTTPDGSDILVAAVQKHHIAEHLALFDAAGVSPARITVDLFSLYGLFKQLPNSLSALEDTALVAIGFSATRIAYIVQNQLKFIRIIPRGLGSCAQEIAQLLKRPYADVQKDVLTFGVTKENDHAFSVAASKVLNSYFDELAFTLNAFKARAKSEQPQGIVVLGSGATMHNLCSLITQRIGIPSHLFDAQLTTINTAIHIKPANIEPDAIISISAALPTPINETFNLRKKEFAVIDTGLFARQIVVASALLLLTISMISVNSYMQQSTLQTAVTKAEKQIIAAAASSLGITGIKNINDLVEEAQRKVAEQDSIWSSFSSSTRSSFLEYLQLLSMNIDQESIRLNLKKLTCTHDTIRMEGEVKDIPSLVILENELKQANLGTFSPPQETKFNITIALKKNGKE